MARCAGCLQPIVARNDFAIHETEVFHRACVSLIPRSMITKAKLRITELQQQLAAARIEGAEAARLRIAIDDANRDARAVRSERDNLERNFQRVSKAATELHTLAESRVDQLDRQIERTEALMAEVAQLRAERDRLIAEAVARDVAIVQAGNTKSEALLDDAAERFRLIELDRDE